MGIFLLLVYNLLAPAIALCYAALFLLSPRRGLLGNLRKELAERLALSLPSLPERSIWVHAASLGEVRAVKPLAPLLRGLAPSGGLLLTSSTSSGKSEALALTPHAALLPLDSYPLMRRFISAARPELLVIAETELWPNLICAAGAAGVPVVLVNARISSRTLSFYRLLSPVARLLFSNVSLVCAQSRGDMERFAMLPLSADKLVLTGNLKHDQVADAAKGADEIRAFLERAGWKDKRIFCAGSTHPEEEDIVLDAFMKVRSAVPDARLILAPRHPEAASSSAEKLRKRGLALQAWSRRGDAAPAPDCLLLDETGLLAGMYAFSELVFVGGTLDDTGGHNVLEPSAFSRPVLFGPNTRNTRDGAAALLEKGGGFTVRTADELADAAIRLFKTPSAMAQAGAASRAALVSLQGATRSTMEKLAEFLPPRPLR